MITLAEKMKTYEELNNQIKALEQEIKDEVMSLGQSQFVGKVKATFYPQGRGSWDWENLAKSLEPDDELIEKHTETRVTIKWNKIVSEIEMAEEVGEEYKLQFYTPGTPFVSLSVK